MSDPKIDLIIDQISDLKKQVTLIQAVLLEVSRPRGRSTGKEGEHSSDCPMSGCEDQTTEPSKG
ncbi:MAG: hypothetical protein WAT68_05690 [Candidatus Nitrotoga sp.]